MHVHTVPPDEATGIFEVALTAAARAFFSKSLDAMGAEPDEALAGTVELFDLVPTGELATPRARTP